MSFLIETRHLSKYYGDFCALDDVSLHVAQGEVLGLLGPNGAGKSTSIKIMTGLLAPSQGQVLLNGHDLLNSPCLAKQSLGYLPEHPPLYPDLTIDEYLFFCGRMRQLSSKPLKQAVSVVKERCQLEGMGRRLIKHLSKGYQQRVGIAQAILHQPRLIVLDEPTSGLDPNQIQEMLSLIKDLSQEQGVLLSTHILSEVNAVCDRVLILHQGKQVYCDDLRASVASGLTYRLCFKHPIDLHVLTDRNEIKQVIECGNRCFEIQVGANVSIDQLVPLWVDYGLLELSPVTSSLSQLFSQLTLGHSA